MTDPKTLREPAEGRYFWLIYPWTWTNGYNDPELLERGNPDMWRSLNDLIDAEWESWEGVSCFATHVIPIAMPRKLEPTDD